MTPTIMIETRRKIRLNLVPGYCLLHEGLPGRIVNIIHHVESTFLIPCEALRLAILGNPGSDHVASLLRIFPPEPSHQLLSRTSTENG